jgi:hypothetical protein
VPGRADPDGFDERGIYRRSDTDRPPARTVEPELVDGVPVDRIYRPRSSANGAGPNRPGWSGSAE